MRNFRYANYSISLFFHREEKVDPNISEQDAPFLKILISIQSMFFVMLHFLSSVGQKNVQFNEKEHEKPPNYFLHWNKRKKSVPFLFLLLQDRLSNTLQFSSGSLPRNARIAVPPSQSHSPYQSQPISRISIPPNSTQSRQHKPIPLSVIMRLQNPYWGAMIAPQPRVVGGQSDMSPYQPAVPVPKEFFQPPAVQPQLKPPELWQPALYSDGKTHFTLANTSSLWFMNLCLINGDFYPWL